MIKSKTCWAIVNVVLNRSKQNILHEMNGLTGYTVDNHFKTYHLADR